MLCVRQRMCQFQHSPLLDILAGARVVQASILQALHVAGTTETHRLKRAGCFPLLGAHQLHKHDAQIVQSSSPRMPLSKDQPWKSVFRSYCLAACRSQELCELGQEGSMTPGADSQDWDSGKLGLTSSAWIDEEFELL